MKVSHYDKFLTAMFWNAKMASDITSPLNFYYDTNRLYFLSERLGMLSVMD